MKQSLRKFVLGFLSSIFLIQSCQTPTNLNKKLDIISKTPFRIKAVSNNISGKLTFLNTNKKFTTKASSNSPNGEVIFQPANTVYPKGTCSLDLDYLSNSYNLSFSLSTNEYRELYNTTEVSSINYKTIGLNKNNDFSYSGTGITNSSYSLTAYDGYNCVWYKSMNIPSTNVSSEVTLNPSSSTANVTLNFTGTGAENSFIFTINCPDGNNNSYPSTPSISGSVTFSNIPINLPPSPTPTATPTNTPTPEPTPTAPPSSCNTNSCPANLKSFSTQSLKISNETKDINNKLISLGIKNNNAFKTQGFIEDFITDITSRIESAYQGVQLDSLVNDYKQNINNANLAFDNALSQEKDFSSLYQQLDNLNNLLDKVDPHKKPDVFDNLIQSKSNLLMEINAKENNFDNLLLNLEQILNTISSIQQAMNQLIDSLSSQPCQCIPAGVLVDFQNALNDYKDRMLNKAIGKGGGKNKIGEHYPDRVAKEMGLTKKERQELSDIIHKEKRGKRGDDNFDLETIRDFAREIIDRRK